MSDTYFVKLLTYSRKGAHAHQPFTEDPNEYCIINVQNISHLDHLFYPLSSRALPDEGFGTEENPEPWIARTKITVTAGANDNGWQDWYIPGTPEEFLTFAKKYVTSPCGTYYPDDSIRTAAGERHPRNEELTYHQGLVRMRETEGDKPDGAPHYSWAMAT